MGNLTVKESGEMVNFISPNVSKITSFKVHFSPKQEGSGDPSPDNVREITGWNGVEGYKCGKNLVPWISTRYICTADHYNGNADWSKLWEIPKRISYTYSVFIDNSNCSTASAVRVWLRDIDNSKYTHYVTGEKINAGEKGFSTVILDFSNLPNDYYAYWGLNLYQNAIASMPIVYESDQETAIISDWSSNIGTVYGGYVDLTSGELVQTIKRVEFTWGDCEDSTILGNTERRYIMFNDNRFKTIDSLKTKISNIFSTFLDNSSWNVDKVSCAFGNKTIICKLPVGSDNNTIIQVAGDLKTPIHYQLTPQQLSTLKGQNNFWSNADYIEIEYELTETFDIQKAKRKIILNQPHVEPASGDIVTFDTDMKGKLKECKVYFSPVQEGEGDPSPDNVRNITGWNGVRVGLPDEYQEVEYIESTGTQYIDTGVTLGTNDSTIIFNFEQTKRTSGEQPITSIWTSDYNYWNLFIRSVSSDKIVLDVYTSAHHMLSTEVNLNEKYTVSLTRNENSWELTQGDSTISWTYSPFKINNTTLKLFKRGDLSTSHSTKIKMYSFKMTISNTRTLNLIPCYRKSDGEIGMYDTVSKQFFTNQGTDTFLKGNDIDGIHASIDWANDVGTVYGGYVDLVSGELVVTHKYASLNDPTKWSAFSGYETTIFSYNDSFFDRKLFNKTTMGFICSLVSTNNTANYWGRWSSKNSDTFWIRNNNSVDSDLWISLEEIKQNASDGNIFICYELATPIHYQLTPQQLSTLKGINNVYSNTNGQTEIKYWKH